MTSDREHEGWRPEVRAFADLMEAQLRANDHKPGWKDELPLNDLFPRLIEEAEELRGELKHGTRGGFAEWSCSVGREAADVANFAMMIADVCGALSRSPVLGGGGETQQDQEVMASVAQSAAAGPSGCAASETARKSEGWTPGPWAISQRAGEWIFATECPDGGDIVCEMPTGDAAESRVRWTANAHLIAAAPDLYEALAEAGGKDGFLLAQIATFIGGMADAYKLTGEAKATADWYWSVLHSVSEKQRAALTRARGEAQ